MQQPRHVGRWQLNAERGLRRIASRGEIDLLSTERVKQIAHYPMDAMLSPGHYFAYSDCDERVSLEAEGMGRAV